MVGTAKQREQRNAIYWGAILLTGNGAVDVTICNISSYGVMVKCASPPPKGAYVEIYRRGDAITGHVRWSSGGRFGIHCQEPINLSAFFEEPPSDRQSSIFCRPPSDWPIDKASTHIGNLDDIDIAGRPGALPPNKMITMTIIAISVAIAVINQATYSN